ncbi:MAG: 50S ribosomal protein L30e [Fervidicoccaceae archaeon]
MSLGASLERELKTAYNTGRVELGTKASLKALKLGRAKVVVVAANANPSTRSDAERYAELSGTPLLFFNGTSVELGGLLGKPFPVQMLAVVDPGESQIVELALSERAKEKTKEAVRA